MAALLTIMLVTGGGGALGQILRILDLVPWQMDLQGLQSMIILALVISTANAFHSGSEYHCTDERQYLCTNPTSGECWQCSEQSHAA